MVEVMQGTGALLSEATVTTLTFLGSMVVVVSIGTILTIVSRPSLAASTVSTASGSKKGDKVCHSDESERRCCLSESPKVSGRLKFYANVWKSYTSDPYILSAATGYELEFDSIPVQLKIPNEIPFSIEEQAIVSQEVQNLLSKGAIIATHNEPEQFISIHCAKS